MVSRPLISIIIPTYNAEPYIGETLDSVLSQTYPRREIIVVDDGSTDRTPQCLEAYSSTIRYLRQENAGAGAARNAGLKAASGDYIAFLDADDLWLPEKLEVQLEVAKKHPESGLIACDGVRFDDTGARGTRLIGASLAKRLDATAEGEVTGYFYRDFIKWNLIPAPAQTLIARSVVDGVGPMLEDLPTCEDWDYYLRIALASPMTFHKHPLVYYRHRPSSLSGPDNLRQFRWTPDLIQVLRRHLHLCRIGDRPHVARGIKAHVRSQAWAAYYYGRLRDLAYARRYLVKLLRLSPSEWLLFSLLVCLYFPDSVASQIRRLSNRIIGLRRSQKPDSHGAAQTIHVPRALAGQLPFLPPR
jgi:glycosyltransferase involved in cell wall biosynthesis